MRQEGSMRFGWRTGPCKQYVKARAVMRQYIVSYNVVKPPSPVNAPGAIDVIQFSAKSLRKQAVRTHANLRS
jgi:hypothetical protein